MIRGSKAFVKSRKNRSAITSARIKQILSFIVDCYGSMKLRPPVYSKSKVKSETNYHFEDYLKMELVDNYLIKNKKRLVRKFSSLEHINFAYHTEKQIVDANGKQTVDKIDIFINKLGLQDLWAKPDEHLYLAIECKRIADSSDVTAYSGDIEKFCTRSYRHFRLPHEGMIAFVENTVWSYDKIATKLNQILASSNIIKTGKNLDKMHLNNGFDGSYQSSHIRATQNKNFMGYHLFLDYSSFITN
jgi:hypothetical protein